MIDSHCHLADPAFAADLDAVVDRARAAGVRSGLCIVTAGDRAEAERARLVASVWPEARFAVGVHPHVAGQYAGRVEEVVTMVRDQIRATPLVCAVGEIGLDYHYDLAPRDVQREVFGRQVGLARELDLPVVVHTREAADDTFAILREEGAGRVTGVFHCFSGDEAMAGAVLDLGFAVSIAGMITFPKAAAIRAAVRVVPPARLLIETDAPYLAPVPHRGRRNEPAFVARVAEAVALARGDTLQSVAESTAAAFEALFHL